MWHSSGLTSGVTGFDAVVSLILRSPAQMGRIVSRLAAMTKLNASDLAHLDPPAREYLLRAEARRVPTSCGTRDQLRTLLAERRLGYHEALWRIEEALGGIEVPDPSGDTALGTYGLSKNQLLESIPGWSTFDFAGESLVWVAATSATVLYARQDASIVEVDFYGGGACVVASSLQKWLGHQLIAIRTGDAGFKFGASVEGAQGERLAGQLGVPLDGGVSDRYRRWWHDEHWSIDEGDYPATGTTETVFYARSATELAEARRLLEVPEGSGSGTR